MGGAAPRGWSPRGSLGLQTQGRILGLPSSWSRGAAVAEVADAGEGHVVWGGGYLLLTSVELTPSSGTFLGRWGRGARTSVWSR